MLFDDRQSAADDDVETVGFEQRGAVALQFFGGSG